jgi:glycosyltransferase involved in cell wall biosynthesis
MKITVIVPAYNEVKNIGANLEILVQVDRIDEIIVVDDGSTDGTSTVTRKFPSVKIIAHESNRGKYQAVRTGVKAAKNEVIMLYDADLIGMKKAYIETLINTFGQGFEMVIMDKGSQSWVFRKLFRSLPAQSGTRIMTKTDFLQIEFSKKRSFDLEPGISRHFICHDKSIGFAKAPETRDPRKFSKYAFLQGIFLDLRTVWQVFTSFGLSGFPKVLSDMWTIERMYRNRLTKPSQAHLKSRLRKRFFLNLSE